MTNMGTYKPIKLKRWQDPMHTQSVDSQYLNLSKRAYFLSPGLQGMIATIKILRFF
jgi:hypothetical protein